MGCQVRHGVGLNVGADNKWDLQNGVYAQGPRNGINSPSTPWLSPPSRPLLLTYRLLPHKMGCKPAQSCTKAEHWPCRVSGEAGVTGDWVPSSTVVLEAVLGPVPVLLATPLRLLA